MPKRLKDNINSSYFEAANQMASKKKRRRIVAYVESYDDIFFWRTVLSQFENDKFYFEVMLPSHRKLERGKKAVLTPLSISPKEGLSTSSRRISRVFEEGIGSALGPAMIACVDADYDYMLQGITPQSKTVLDNPFVFHTYAYAIENMQCYAPSLHDVCVMVTLNDHRIFDFQDYLRQYSEAIFPLFVWSVWAYRTGNYHDFTLSDFARIVDPGGFNIFDPQPSIEHLRRKVNTKVHQLQTKYPDNKEAFLQTKESIKALGVTPQTTYLYVQGHSLFDNVIVPIMSKVCNRLRMERQEEISRTARHHTQRRNEMSCYEHSLQDIRQMLKKNTGYMLSEPFRRIQQDVEHFLEGNGNSTVV